MTTPAVKDSADRHPFGVLLEERRPSRKTYLAVFGVSVLLVSMVVVSVGLLLYGGKGGTSNLSRLFQVPLCLAPLLPVFYALRTIHLYEGGVEVRSLGRRKAVAYQDVVEIRRVMFADNKSTALILKDHLGRSVNVGPPVSAERIVELERRLVEVEAARTRAALAAGDEVAWGKAILSAEGLAVRVGRGREKRFSWHEAAVERDAAGLLLFARDDLGRHVRLANNAPNLPVLERLAGEFIALHAKEREKNEGKGGGEKSGGDEALLLRRRIERIFSGRVEAVEELGRPVGIMRLGGAGRAVAMVLLGNAPIWAFAGAVIYFGAGPALPPMRMVGGISFGVGCLCAAGGLMLLRRRAAFGENGLLLRSVFFSRWVPWSEVGGVVALDRIVGGTGGVFRGGWRWRAKLILLDRDKNKILSLACNRDAEKMFSYTVERFLVPVLVERIRAALARREEVEYGRVRLTPTVVRGPAAAVPDDPAAEPAEIGRRELAAVEARPRTVKKKGPAARISNVEVCLYRQGEKGELEPVILIPSAEVNRLAVTEVLREWAEESRKQRADGCAGDVRE